ncbi:hypothetical protein [Oryzihumus leptocrescens]|uniref:hypothetical protein n=1 Tax=Oryzihumus leptocrescens TaxID=297536 RepID=UPI0011515D1B|nr:hypothetical protein [Oryzihumus leptocrescens]
MGHEDLPAAALGVFDDGEHAAADVPYCADCAAVLIAAGEYRITAVLDPVALAAGACPVCGGTGQVPRPLGQTGGQAQNVIRDVVTLVRQFDDTPISQMSALFYQHGYEELRLAVRHLLRLLGAAD